MTNQDGSVREDSDFLPYGEEKVYVDMLANRYKFTGYERDAESGSDYAMFRFYRSNQGRFLSPDPVQGNVFNPQSWNRYAYVNNNPLNAVDSLGLCFYGNNGGTFYTDNQPCPWDWPINQCDYIVCAQPGVPGTNPYDIPQAPVAFRNILPNIAMPQSQGSQGGLLKSLVCSVTSPLLHAASAMNGVVGAGVGGGGAIGFILGISGSFGLQVVADPNHNVGLITTASFNPGVPPVLALGGNAGGQVSYTATNNISNLPGYSGVASGGFGPVSVDVSAAPGGTPGVTVTGGVGWGPRFSGSNGLSSTKLWTSTTCH
jgi:RHS repeat-associated protein